MYNVLLAIDLILALFLGGMVMLQRSEGGALGGLGGGTGSSFMTGRSVGNALSKATAITAALFFACTLALGVVAKRDVKSVNILQNLPTQAEQSPVESAPVESTPAEQVPVENASVEQVSAETTPAE